MRTARVPLVMWMSDIVVVNVQVMMSRWKGRKERK